MNFLSKFGSSAAKKEREKELQHGDRILVEFGYDRDPLYINMFDIPRTAQLFISAMGLPSLKRRIKLPDVAKFMYDNYLAFINMDEDSAEIKPWVEIIMLAYTTKVLQDTLNHDKALLTMIAKGEAVNYKHDLMFTSNDWTMLQLHVHANDTRDEAMRQVLSRLFMRSDGLMEFLGVSHKQFAAVGLDWKAFHKRTAVAKIAASNKGSTEPSTELDEGFVVITKDDLEVTSTDGNEYDSFSIRSFSTVGGDSDAGDAVDLGGHKADDLSDVGDLDADSDMVNSIIAAVAQIDTDAATLETRAVNTKDGDNTAVATESEETIPVNAKAEDNVATTTNAEGNTPVATEAKENVAVNNDAEKNTTVDTEVEENVAVTTKADDNATATTDVASTTEATGSPLLAYKSTEKSPDLIIWAPQAIRLHPTGSSTRHGNDDAEFKAGFAPRRELRRTPPGSPSKAKQVLNTQEDHQTTDVEANIKPAAQIYVPPHRRQDSEATPSRWNDRTTPGNSREFYKHPRGRGRQLPNLKWAKSVLNTQRAKQAVWPGDADSNNPDNHRNVSTNWRQPKAPTASGDWNELKEAGSSQEVIPENFAVGAPARFQSGQVKRLVFSYEKGVHDVSCDM